MAKLEGLPVTHHAAIAEHAALPVFDQARLIAYMIDRKGWTPDRAAQAVEIYGMFLTFHRLFPDERHALSVDADEVWHAHLIDTRAYHADCERILGRYLHHDPHAHISPELRRTSEERYLALFGAEVICNAASM